MTFIFYLNFLAKEERYLICMSGYLKGEELNFLFKFLFKLYVHFLFIPIFRTFFFHSIHFPTYYKFFKLNSLFFKLYFH